MIGTIKFSSRTQYGRNKRNIPFYSFQSINNENYLVASKMKTKIDHYAVIDILDAKNSVKKGCIKEILGPINNYNTTKKFILFKNKILPNKKLNFEYEDINLELVNEPFTYSIDPKGSRDIDDAFSYNDNELIIHITDLTSIKNINIEGLLQKTSTFYDKDKNYNMFPPEISEDKFSLLEGQERNTISLSINFETKECNIYKSRIKVVKNLTYEEADKLFENEWIDFRKNVELIIGEFTDSHEFIEKIMIFYNIEFSKFLYKQNKDYPIRVHAGIKLDKLYESKFINDKLKKRICYHSAEYSSVKSEYTIHQALELEKYTHTTSPLRRAIDFINQNIAFNNLEINILDLCEKVNKRTYELKKAYNEIKLLDLGIEMKEENRIFEGIIIEFNENQIKVYIKELDIIQYIEVISYKIANILDFKLQDNKYIISNPRRERNITLNLFQNIKIKTMIKTYESKLYKRMQFFIIDPDVLFLVE
tara:strand:+ start:2459 stop:3892 length:1434 start_codon:yes stop_codon:yes gene_type:complete